MKHLAHYISLLMFCCLSTVAEAQSPFASSKQSVLLSNGQSGASERWISIFAASALSSNYTLSLSTSITLNSFPLSVSSITSTIASLTNLLPASLGSPAWSLTGNDGTTSSNFVGTTDVQPLRFRTNNQQRGLIDANGLFGVGMSNLSGDFHVKDNGAYHGLVLEKFGTSNPPTIYFAHARGTESARTAVLDGDWIARIYPMGYYGSGYNVTYPVMITGTASENHSSTNKGIDIDVQVVPNGSIEGSKQFIVRNNGRVGVGTTTPSELFEVWNGFSTGTYTTFGWQHSSDSSLKTNVQPISHAVQTVAALQGVFFDWKNIEVPNRHQIGFIAQDVASVLPEVVQVNNGEYSVTYDAITAVHTQAIHELDSIVSMREREQTTAANQSFIYTQTAIDNAVQLSEGVWQVEYDMLIRDCAAEITLVPTATNATIELVQFEKEDAQSNASTIVEGAKPITFLPTKGDCWVRVSLRVNGSNSSSVQLQTSSHIPNVVSQYSFAKRLSK